MKKFVSLVAPGLVGLLVIGTLGCAGEDASDDESESSANAVSTPRDEEEKQTLIDQKQRMRELQPELQAATAKDFEKDFPKNLGHFLGEVLSMVMHVDMDPGATVYSFKNGAKDEKKTYVFETKRSAGIKAPAGEPEEHRFYLYDAVSDGGYAGFFAKELKPRAIGMCKSVGKSDQLTCQAVSEGADLFDADL